jgi:hypothetical protein
MDAVRERELPSCVRRAAGSRSGIRHQENGGGSKAGILKRSSFGTTPALRAILMTQERSFPFLQIKTAPLTHTVGIRYNGS